MLTAQFVLMNVVIAVLMKQLEEANSEVKKDEQDALELEAQKLKNSKKSMGKLLYR